MRTALLVMVFSLLWAPAGRTASTGQIVERGNELFRQQDYAASVEKYKEGLQKAPESDIINFNIGTAYYKEGDYVSTISHLQKSLLSDNVDLQANAHYNLGNAYYRWGLTKEDRDAGAAIADLEEAVQHYERTLATHPQDEDARFNREVVQREIERLKEKQKQQQQQQQQKQESGGQQEDQQQSSSGSDQSAQDPQTRKQQNQQDQQNPQEQRSGQQDNASEQRPEPEDQASQSPSGEQSSSPQESAGEEPSQTEQGTSGLTRKEAEMLLNHYQQKEEPQGLLNIMKRKGAETPVQKDW